MCSSVGGRKRSLAREWRGDEDFEAARAAGFAFALPGLMRGGCVRCHLAGRRMQRPEATNPAGSKRWRGSRKNRVDTVLWCPGPESNRHALRRGILSPLRLPISPPGQVLQRTRQKDGAQRRRRLWPKIRPRASQLLARGTKCSHRARVGWSRERSTSLAISRSRIGSMASTVSALSGERISTE